MYVRYRLHVCKAEKTGSSHHPPTDGRHALSSAEAEAFIEAFREGWRAPDGPEGLTEGFLPHLDPEIRLIQPQLAPAVGHKAFRRDFAEPLYELVPDARAVVHSSAARGNTVFIQFDLVGTLGGRPLRLPCVDRFELRDGRAVERRAYFDSAELLTAVARSPRAWPRFARLQLRAVRDRINPKERR